MDDYTEGVNPATERFWLAAREHVLLLTYCAACSHSMLFPRPWCIVCGARNVMSTPSLGRGWIYSLTTVRVQWWPGRTPPYLVAVVELEEGPRMLTNIIDDVASIGDQVVLDWKERGSDPPLPVFRRAQPN